MPWRNFLFSSLALAQLSSSALAQTPEPETAARELVESETKLDQIAREQGARAAFLEFLSSAAVVFRPGPVNGTRWWTKQPENDLWITRTPALAAMARSGD